MAKRLGIVGAGAKAAAIVARAAALRELGVPEVPEIVVFETDHIGSAWSGQGGFSNGQITLCTPGEKDVGFPYRETRGPATASSALGPYLFGRFSWQAYLVARSRFMDWVDRGRDHPTHANWANYLKWVFEQAAQAVVPATVTNVQPTKDGWQVHSIDRMGRKSSNPCDGVVLTGTGRAKSIAIDPDMPSGRVFDAETFWSNPDAVGSGSDTTVTVVGDGGAAGTIIAWLVDNFAQEQRSILSLSGMGTLFPRGDGYSERRWFSDPSEWSSLSFDHRRKLMERTEAGVISLRNKATIDASPRVQMHIGRAERAIWEVDRFASKSGDIELKTSYSGQSGPSIKTDYLICAIGFEPWSLLGLVDTPAARTLAQSTEKQRAPVEEAFSEDLTLPAVSGLPWGLHVPALSGLAQGPGMGNLGCLGLMAEAVLEPYL